YIEQSDRLSMPIRDEENRIVTLWKYNKNPNSYINDKGLEVTPGKVLFTKGRERCPFNLYDLQEYRKDINQEVYLCGGEKDTLNMIGNGHRAITLGSENENLKEKYKPLFQDLKIVIAYDNDDAGQKGAEKILKQLQCVAKEIKVWNWNKVQKNQDLTLFKGFDMTDYLSVIKKQNLEFDKTNYKNEKKDVEMKAEEFKKFRENTEKKFGISFEDVRNSDDSELKSKWLDEYNNQKENRPKKELLQKT
ncbi:toprim domain-containing protein, partial [Aliarcobacter butzleri]|nr:toprim domain-containing protein [Aliarcobacter butzleri]